MFCMLMNDGKLRHKTAKVLKHLHGDAWCGSEEMSNVKRKKYCSPFQTQLFWVFSEHRLYQKYCSLLSNCTKWSQKPNSTARGKVRSLCISIEHGRVQITRVSSAEITRYLGSLLFCSLKIKPVGYACYAYLSASPFSPYKKCS